MTVPASQQTLALFGRYVAKAMGLHFREDRLGELERLITAASGEFGCDDPEACMLWLMAAPLTREQLDILARTLTIGETYFFRDRQSYQVLEERMLPKLIGRRRNGDKCLRIWSAGCSSGEEPYSIAILLSRLLADLKDWNITLLATDINPRVLEKGRLGVYSKWSFRDAPPWLMDYFSRRKDGSFEIIPRIRKMVQFGHLNLAEDSYPSLVNNTNAMDIIFCRNVMLYFEQPLIKKMIARFHNSIRDGGWLFVSPTEIGHRAFDGFVCRRFAGALVFRKGAENPLPPPVWEVPSSSAPPLTVAVPPPMRILPIQGLAVPRLPAGHEQAIAFGSETPAGAAATLTGDTWQEALARYEEGRYELAAAKAMEVIGTGTGGVEPLELLARSYANLGRFAEAKNCCEEAIALDRLRANNQYLLAMILLEQGERDEAATTLKRTLYLDQDFLLAHFTLGNLNRQTGREKEAQRNFTNALRLLEKRELHEVLPEADGMTAGRLAEIIRAMTK